MGAADQRREDQSVTGTETRRALRDDRADWHPCVAALIDAAADVHVVETAQLVRPLPRLAVGRVALLGDAARTLATQMGFTPPVTLH